MVPSPAGTLVRHSALAPAIEGAIAIPDGGTASSPTQLAKTGRLEIVRRRFEEQGFSEPLVNLLLANNRRNTRSAYETSWGRWDDWCVQRGADPLSTPISLVLEFLTFLHDSGKAYNTVNVYRSMLSATLPEIDGQRVGSHPLVKQLLGGCYNTNPPRPRLDSTWDPEVVLAFISTLGDNITMSMSDLTRKTAMLLALTSLLRVSELVVISLSSIVFSQSSVRFTLTKPRKAQHSGPLQSFIVPSFEDQTRCPVETMRAYIDRSKEWRSSVAAKTSLCIALVAPHSAVTSNTISRWVKALLELAGIDLSTFTAHSTRGAAASAAAAKGATIESILSAGSWTIESTFNRFYKRVPNTTVASLVLGTASAE